MARVLPFMPAAERVDKVRLSFLDWLATDAKERHDNYAIYRDYYDGNHATQLTERMRRYLQVKSGQEFNANYCPIVIDALAEKLKVIGFDAGDEQSAVLWKWWQQNRMDQTQGEVHLSASTSATKTHSKAHGKNTTMMKMPLGRYGGRVRGCKTANR
jgi:hypothetical protein